MSELLDNDMNHYAKAIDIYNSVIGSQAEKDALLLEILKTCPSAVIKASKGMERQIALAGLTAVERNVLSIAMDGSKIKAIKQLREDTDLGLREAKEKVEYLVELAE